MSNIHVLVEAPSGKAISMDMDDLKEWESKPEETPEEKEIRDKTRREFLQKRFAEAAERLKRKGKAEK